VRTAPGPSGSRTLYYLRLRRTDPVGFYTQLFSEYGDFVRVRLGPLSAFISGSPDAARHILMERHGRYSKGAAAERFAKVIGKGLITSEGALWQAQRRLIRPAFTAERLVAFSQTITRVTGRHIRETMPGGRDFQKEVTALTLRLIAESVLGSDLTSEVDRIMAAFTRILDHLERMLVSPARALELLPDWPPLRGARRLLHNRTQVHHRGVDDAVAELDDVVRIVTMARRRSPAQQPDLLSVCLAGRDKETGEGMSDQQIRDEVLTVLLAGHETTAVALTWTALDLAWHPEVARNLKAELDFVLEGRTPTYSDLPRLRYTKAVVDESMRLHPPVWRISRKALEDDEVCGYRVPKGSEVVISPYLLHRSPALWSDPESFRPERFLKDDGESVSKLGFIPFGAGPRKCIGNHLATIEAIVILASYCQRFRFTVAPGFAPELDPKLTLRIRGEVPIHLEELHDSRCGREPERRTSGS